MTGVGDEGTKIEEGLEEGMGEVEEGVEKEAG